ncbi:TolC family protein [uncultured Tenacibaculum sp.]|uniref:TolC family protein n=1 Tax=uncultured Tenacibaculum sp. TaxID=174713 RepID=UPI00261B9471|nr:TolC family protein [uncultured Tenacibaculum sp.]
MKNKKLLLLFPFLLVSILSYSQKKWTLKECVDHALKNNIQIKQNILNINSSEKDKEIAYGEFLPSLSASNSHNFTFGLSTGADNTRSSANRYNTSLNLSLGGSIFNGFRNLNSYKQAKLGIERSKLDLEVIQNDVALRVVNTYLNVLFAKENLEVAKFQADISKKQIDRAQAQFDTGSIPKGDLLNIQSTAATDAQNVVSQENALNIALLNLSQLLQLDNQGFDVEKIEVGTPSAALLYSSSSQVYEKALKDRPEIERARLNIEDADLAIKISKSAYIPSLNYSLSTGTFYNTTFGQPDFFTFPDPDTGQLVVIDRRFSTQLNDNFSYGGGFSISIPIFNRFQTKNRIHKSIIAKEQAELRLETEKLSLKQTIEQAFLDAKAAAKTFEAASISLESQNEAFKNAQASYEYGAMTRFDYDQVRNRLVNAESALIRAKFDYIFKTKVLKFYYGENILD